MAFARPTLSELITRTQADIQTRLGTGPLTTQSVLGVLARVLAGASHMQHGHLDWVSRQAFPTTAEGEYLVQWADVWGLARKAAVAARGPLLIQGVPGTSIPAGTTFQRADGARFRTQVVYVIGGQNSVQAVVQAEVAGDAGDTLAGTVLTLTSPISGVTSTATVQAPGLVNGSDTETDAQLRARLLQRIQERPMGGAARDYVAWALEVPEITRAWCLPAWQGAGTVGVVVVADGGASIVPDAAKLAEVQAYLDDRRPVTATVTAIAPTLLEIDVQLAVSPATAEVQAAVEASLRSAIDRVGGPSQAVLRSQLSEAVSTTPGETDHQIYVPTGNVPVGPTEVATLGTVSFV